MRHELKCWPREYAQVAAGKKRHEVRRNDCKFQEGDVVVLREWSGPPNSLGYSGYELAFTIGHVTAGPSWGLPEDLCVFTLLEVTL